MRQLKSEDASALKELTDSEESYRFLPTFLFEKKYDDSFYVISRMYDECLEDSLILGIFTNGEFCGLAELYGYRAPFLKISVGYRLIPRFWGRGIATEVLGLLVRYLFSETDIRYITASVLPENEASAAVLKKNGFRKALYSVPEDWGHARLEKTDKWIKKSTAHKGEYTFL